MLVLFGPGHSGFLGLIKWLRGRKVATTDGLHIDHSSDNVILKVEGDSNTIVVNKNVYNLYHDQTAREAAESVVNPLNRDGMDDVTIGDFDGLQIPSVRITSDDAPLFKAPPPEGKIVHESTSEVYLRVVAPNFQAGSKWRFAQGETSFFAAIEDERFWDRVRKYEETFGDGDIMVADMRTETREIDGKEKIVRTIINVKDHKPPKRYRQLELDEEANE